MNFSISQLSQQFIERHRPTLDDSLYNIDFKRDQNGESKGKIRNSLRAIVAEINTLKSAVEKADKIKTSLAQFRINKVSKDLDNLTKDILHHKEGAVQRAKKALTEPVTKAKEVLEGISTEPAFIISKLMNLEDPFAVRTLVNGGLAINEVFRGVSSMLEGSTPLTHIIKEWGQTEFAPLVDKVQFLVEELGADVNLCDKKGSPLTLAIENDDIETVRYLLEQKADPDQADSEKRHPTEMAIEDGQNEILILLLKHGANPELQVDGMMGRPCSLKELARDFENEEAIDILEEFIQKKKDHRTSRLS